MSVSDQIHSNTKSDDFEKVLKQVKSIIDLYEKHAELSGERFNIFSIMGMESDEVRTHSAIIGELLNPKGNHSLGSKPLELFIDYIFTKENAIEIDYNSSTCQTEVYIGKVDKENPEGGRIDLMISDRIDCKIVIENKIYAPEQEKQLERYNKKYPKAKILYLTLDGADSKEDFNDYYKISYENHILNWIEACAKEAYDKPMIREVLNQYAFLIRKLTNQTMNIEMKEELQEVIKSNYIESLEIYKNFEKVRNSFVKEAFDKIKAKNIFNEWNVEFDVLNIWSPNTSQVLLFANDSISKNFFYLRFEYSSSKLFLGIVPREPKKNGKRSIQREEVRFSSNYDFIMEYVKTEEETIHNVITAVQNYIKNNQNIYNQN